MSIGESHAFSDNILLVELGKGSVKAFEELYEKYWSNVFDEAYKRIGDRDLAKDIAQEVFMSMWTRGTEIPIENLPAWLYTVTKNNVFKLIKKQERFVPIPDLLSELQNHEGWADALIVEKQLIATYKTLIESLPSQQCVIFKMRYEDELTPNEIALKLKLSPKTVRNHLGRAIYKLKTTLMIVQLAMMLIEKN
jgi:RNA polymerase sigma-70 factor (ECF subfamily)